MIITDKVKALQQAGYFVGRRDAAVNTKYRGRFMVVEADYKEQMKSNGVDTTEDGVYFYTIVSDRLPDLIHDSYKILIEP